MRTMMILGALAVAAAGAVACSGGSSEPPPGLELASDPSASTNLPKRQSSESTSPPMAPSDAPVLEPAPSPADGGPRHADAGATSDASAPAAPADAGTTTAPEAGAGAATYTARCNGYSQSEREHEANDTVATANTLADFTCAGINSANDVDYYVFDSSTYVELTFDPDDDAAISIKSPSGIVSSAQGGAVYHSGERGRYFVAIYSPGHKLQTYFIVR